MHGAPRRSVTKGRRQKQARRLHQCDIQTSSRGCSEGNRGAKERGRRPSPTPADLARAAAHLRQRISCQENKRYAVRAQVSAFLGRREPSPAQTPVMPTRARSRRTPHTLWRSRMTLRRVGDQPKPRRCVRPGPTECLEGSKQRVSCKYIFDYYANRLAHLN